MPPRDAPRPDHQELAAIFAGGVLGALARSALAQEFPTGPAQWPWATFARYGSSADNAVPSHG